MANKKFTDLDPAGANPTLVDTDILAVTLDPANTPVSRKTSISNLMTKAPVQSVNTATGAVVLDADDIDDTATAHKFVTASDITNLSNLSGTNSGDQDLSSYQLQPAEGAFVDGDKTKLDNIEANADVTDATNVEAAGALMDSEVTNLAEVKAFNSSDYATAFFSTVTESTTARTLSDSDNGKVIVCTNTGQITITVPSGLTAGFGCTVVQDNTGQVTVTGSGAVVNGVGGKNTTNGQYSALNIIPVGANDYIVDGVGLVTPPFANAWSLSFDGTNDYLAINSTATVYSFSIWFKPYATLLADTGSIYTILSRGGSAMDLNVGGSVTGFLSNELISSSTSSLGWYYTAAGGSISNTQYHHIFLGWVSNSSTNSGNPGYDIWLNGTKVGNASYNPPSSPFSLSSNARIGSRGDGSRWFRGEIDEVAIWTTDVSSDIATIYNSGTPDDLSDTNVVSTGPAHWWRMGDSNGGTGNVTDDGSLNVTATVNGATYSSTVP